MILHHSIPVDVNAKYISIVVDFQIVRRVEKPAYSSILLHAAISIAGG